MKVNLICSPNTKSAIEELLPARNITVDTQAEICIIESGFTPLDNRICILFHPGQVFALLDILSKLSKPNGENYKVVGKSENEKYRIIAYNGIYCFEGRGNYTFCITANGEYSVKEKLYELEDKLPQDRFVRVGKSYIVNIENVKEITPWFGRRLLLKFPNSDKVIEVSKSYVKSFREFLGM